MRNKCLLIVILCFAKPAIAQVTGIASTPGSPTIGTAFQVSTVMGPAPVSITGFLWCSNIVIPGNVGVPTSIPGGSTCPMVAAYPGYYLVGCQVTYAPFTMLATATFWVTIPVAPPNGLIMSFGNNIPTLPGNPATLRWKIMSGQAQVGANMAGILQGRCINVTQWDGEPIPDGDWIPQISSAMYIAQGMIWQSYLPIFQTGDWSAIGVGQTIISFDMQLQIVFGYQNATGSTFYYYANLPTIHWVVTKINPTNWTVACTN